jgi:hypothetical protein
LVAWCLPITQSLLEDDPAIINECQNNDEIRRENCHQRSVEDFDDDTILVEIANISHLNHKSSIKRSLISISFNL